MTFKEKLMEEHPEKYDYTIQEYYLGCPEHYADPTAYNAIKNVDKQRKGWLKPEEFREVKERHHKLLGCIFRICELSGFTVENRIELRDKKTGKVWK